ncbi:MAG: hypothetical protein QOG52_2577, partial [Frankiaceae bacterium]|nr:hypothetical protein [Frankiaceae bacterium]
MGKPPAVKIGTGSETLEAPSEVGGRVPTSRQKKRARRRGQQHQQAVQASRRMEELAEGAAHALLDRILDPSTPPHDVAELLLVTHDRADLAPEGWGQVLARNTNPRHVRSTVAVLDGQAADSLFAVSFGVDALAPIDVPAAGDRLAAALA